MPSHRILVKCWFISKLFIIAISKGTSLRLYLSEIQKNTNAWKKYSKGPSLRKKSLISTEKKVKDCLSLKE
jgi:hypothetical protein